MAFVFLILVFFIDQWGVSDKHCLLSLFSFVLNLFDKKNKWFVTFGTQIFELWVSTEVKVYRDTFKNDISFWIYVWIYVNIWYENFSFHFSIVQLLWTILKAIGYIDLITCICVWTIWRFLILPAKEDCISLRKLQRLSTCCVRYEINF